MKDLVWNALIAAIILVTFGAVFFFGYVFGGV